METRLTRAVSAWQGANIMVKLSDIPGLIQALPQAQKPAQRMRQPARAPLPPRAIAHPEPGFWMIRLVKDGPRVPARIFRHTTTHEPGNPENLMERPSFLCAEILGHLVRLDRVWLRSGVPIDAAEFEFQMQDFQHAAAHRPADPKAAPKKRVDLTLIPPVY